MFMLEILRDAAQGAGRYTLPASLRLNEVTPELVCPPTCPYSGLVHGHDRKGSVSNLVDNKGEQ